MLVIIGLFAISVSTDYVSGCTTASQTTVTGSHAHKLIPEGQNICSGDLIFEESFDKFDLSKWQHELTLGGGGNWEFEYYTNNRSNSYVENGYLHIRPTLLADEFGEAFLSSGTLDINGGSPADACTNAANYGCSRTGSETNYLNSVKSARIRTTESFSFKYGKLEVNARVPAGDWLWPAIWLLPRYNQYSGWPASGEIDVMESRGNKNLEQNGVNIGTQQVSHTLHWGPNYNYNRYELTHFEKNNAAGYDTDFHRYQLEWTPEHISFGIDDVTTGTITPPAGGFWDLGGLGSSGLENPWRRDTKMAPFDQEFYILINLAVGGTNGYFPDDVNNPGGKPWSSSSATAYKDFWLGKSQWYPTWNAEGDSSHFVIDYVKVFAL